MTTYEEFVKPYLKPKDGYDHIVVIRYYVETSENPDKPKYYIDKKNTDKLDDIISNMQRDGYEIINFSLETTLNEYRDYMVLRYK